MIIKYLLKDKDIKKYNNKFYNFSLFGNYN